MSDRTQRRFRDRVTIALESHVAQLQASVATIEHHERPEYLDRLAVLRDQVFVLDHMYMSLFTTCGWVLRLGVTVVLLDLDPSRARAARRVRAADGVHVDLAARRRARGARSAAPRRNRLARHLFDTATTAPPGKEVRVTRIGERLVARAARRVGALVRRRSPPRAAAARCGTRCGWALFGAAYVGAIVFVSSRARRRRRATCCWCSPPARGCRPTSARPSARSASCAASGSTARGAWRGSRTTRPRVAEGADAPAPPRARARHPLRARVVRLPGHRAPGARRREPRAPARLGRRDRRRERRRQDHAGEAAVPPVPADGGRILVDGVPLARMPADDWRERLAGAFQDFFRFEFRARHSVGVGDLPRLDDAPAVAGAVERAGASDRGRRSSPRASRPSSARPGRTASRSASASGRSSRSRAASCASGRCCSCSTSRPPRSTPRPSTRCSSATPHAADARRREAITVLVSHRFRTVRMADLIVVLDGARVVEVGHPRRR